MDDEQLNYKIKSVAKKDYLGNEFVIKLNG